MKRNTISARSSAWISMFLYGLILVSLTMGIMTYANHRYQYRMVCLYGRLHEQIDCNQFYHLLNGAGDSDSYELGRIAMQEEGYGTWAEKELLLISHVDTKAVGAFLFVGLMMLILFHFLFLQAYGKDRQRISAAAEGILRGESVTGSCTFAENEQLLQQCAKIGEWNRLRIQESLKKQQQVTEILENIAHQMKTPLAGVQMYLEILVSTEADSQRKKKIAMCQQSVEGLQQMVFRILRMARLDSGQVNMSLENATLQMLWDRACRNNYYLQTKKNIDLELTGDIDKWINCDPFWTEEAITNVLNNALAYTEAGKCIHGYLSEYENRITLKIMNDGPIIPMSEYEHIFDRFYHRGKDNGGDGIGLHMAKTIMQMQGGNLRVLPMEKGNCFEFTFHETMGKSKLRKDVAE